MPDTNFLNPFLNPIFIPVLIRTLVLFAGGFLVLLAVKKFSFKSLFESKLGKIYIGWVIITPIYIAGIFLGGIPSLIILFVLIVLALKEVYVRARFSKLYFVTLCLLAFYSIIITSYFPQFFYTLPLLYFVITTGIAIRENDSKRGFLDAALTLFILIWIVFSFCHSILLGHMNNLFDNTKALLLLIMFATSLSDIGAYVFGKFFHRINFLDKFKIANTISPNKTYIGIIGHILGAGLGIGIMYFAIQSYLPWYHWVIISILIGVFGVMGGLTNSLFKRFYEVKDSSNLIPGHGGILDRIDSIIRVVVVLYYYFLIFLK